MVNEYAWSDAYSIGIPEIDEQHKTLFGLLEQLNSAISARRGSTACSEVLKQLVEYTHIHFALEQSLMHLGHYPDYEEHCKLHQSLIEEVVALQEKVDTGSVAISFELLHFLRNWLTKHILGEDMKYAEFFNEVGHQKFTRWSEESDQAVRSHKRKWWKFW